MPVGVGAAVLLLHFLWLGLFPERDPVQDQWENAPVAATSWLEQYVRSQSYWLGISYGIALAFAAVAFRQYRERGACAARNAAIGGVTLSGILSILGCFLLGCCGSPMLGVYLSLFGTAFVRMAKPLTAAVTVMSVLIGWWWMRRHLAMQQCCLSCDGDAQVIPTADPARAAS